MPSGADQPQIVLDAYIRVSRVGKRTGDSFMSPKQQKDVIDAWAKANNVVIGAYFQD